MAVKAVAKERVVAATAVARVRAVMSAAVTVLTHLCGITARQSTAAARARGVPAGREPCRTVVRSNAGGRPAPCRLQRRLDPKWLELACGMLGVAVLMAAARHYFINVISSPRVSNLTD